MLTNDFHKRYAYFRVAMFYSTDLLSIRGGKFSTVWLIGNRKDRKHAPKKKRVEIRKIDITSIYIFMKKC